MKGHRIFAVLTGDLVKSASYQSQRGEILNRLRDIFDSARKFEKNKDEFIIFSNIYRGDSFQGIVSRPSVSLTVALYIRSELLKILIGKERTDARISIGLGTVDFLNKERVEESDGEAFRFSGEALDRIKTYRRMSISSPWEEMNKQFSLLSSFLDALIQRWSVEQAEAISLWLQRKTQQSISKALGISQPAVQQRLQTAGHFAVREGLDYFQGLMDKI